LQVQEGAASKELISTRLANAEAALSKREPAKDDGAELSKAASKVRRQL
jgi:hypothetical protein